MSGRRPGGGGGGAEGGRPAQVAERVVVLPLATNHDDDDGGSDDGGVHAAAAARRDDEETSLAQGDGLMLLGDSEIDDLFGSGGRMNGSDSDHFSASAGPSDVFGHRRPRARVVVSSRLGLRSRSPPALPRAAPQRGEVVGGGSRHALAVLGGRPPSEVLSEFGSLGAACHAALTGASLARQGLCHLGSSPIGSPAFQATCEDAARVVISYARAGRQVYVGITENPERRFAEHLATNASWQTCRILVQAPTSRESSAIERFVIARIRDRFLLCSNDGPGGERASQGMPHFVYLLVGGSLLRR